MKKNILIVCDDNTLLSKLAEAYLRKYAGFWKNIFSAGIDITGKKISVDLSAILEEDQLNASIEYKLKSISEYEPNSCDYIIALTPKSYEYCKSKMQEKEIILLDIKPVQSIQTATVKELSIEIKSELLKFAKNGPIKRWLELI